MHYISLLSNYTRQESCSHNMIFLFNFESETFRVRVEGLTSWPGRWTRLHISWQTRLLSPEPSPQSKPSRRHRLWHRGSSLRHHSAPQWCTGTDAEHRQRKGTNSFEAQAVISSISLKQMKDVTQHIVEKNMLAIQVDIQ